MLKKTLIVSLICFGGLFSSSAAPTLGGPTLSATGGSTNSSSGGVDTNAVIALIEQYGGGGGVVSNTVVQLTVDTWYTNGQYPVVVEAQIELPNRVALMLFSVKDTNSAVIGYLPGSAAWNEFGNASKYAFATTTATEDNVQSLGGYVPAYAAFRYYASGTTASIYDNAPNGTRLVYFGSGTNSGGVNASEIVPLMRTNGVALTYDAKGYGAAGNNSTDDTLVISNVVKLANWTSAATVGEAYIPKGVYLISNEILAGGTVGNPSIPNANWQAGYSSIRGSRDAIIRQTANTNAMRTLNGMRMVTISDLIFLGTNYNGAASSGFHNGLVLDGPGGHLTVRDVMAHSFNAGFVLQDITDCDMQNIWAASNFVGVATEYKPDNVRIYGRFERNRYGVMNHWTNATYTTRNTAGQLLVSGDFGYNYVGILVSGGHARIGPVYFEGNTHAAIQIGLNTSDAYELSYFNVGTVEAPNVLIDSFDANQNSNDIEVYTNATIRFIHAGRMATIDGGVPIRLNNANADLSTISGDANLTVIDSSSRTWTVPAGWRYQAGELMPAAGWENMATPSYIVLQDEFAGGVTTSGQIGDLGWTLAAGTAAKLAQPLTDWDGKYSFTTGTTSNNSAQVYLAGSLVPPYGTNFVASIKFKIPNTNVACVVVGIQTTSGYEMNFDVGDSVGRRSAGAFMVFTNAGAFRFETRPAGGAVGSSSLSTVAANTNWNTLTISRTNTTIYMSLNGETFVNCGTGALNSGAHYYGPTLAIATGDTTAKAIWVDWWTYRARRSY